MLKNTLLLLVFISSACTQKSNEFNYESSELLEVLNSAELESIKLDELPIQIVKPASHSDIIGKISNESDSIFIGGIVDAISIHNQHYLVDIIHNKIIKTDSNGFNMELIGTIGRGPGEFSSLKRIDHNNQFIYVFDAGNSKIHLFNHEWNYNHDFILKSTLFDNVFSVTDKYLFVSEEMKEKSIIKVLTSTPLFEEVTSLLPRLIPIGKQPFSYNKALISSNDKITAVAYSSLPFIFIFDDKFNHVKTLHVQSKKIKAMPRPPLKIVNEVSGTGIGVPSAFFGFKVLANNDLILSLGKEVYYLEYNGKFRYELISSSYLHYADSAKQESDGYGIIAKHINQDHEYILISSITEDKAYRFLINELRGNNRN